jgi:hypothetical protein
MVVEAGQDVRLVIGLNCIGFGPERTARHSETTKLNHFESAFGINPNVCSIIFHEIQIRDIRQKQIRKPKVPYFLLALYWLMRYPVEKVSSGLFGYHEDTIRKWVWKYCEAIQALKQYKVSVIALMNFYQIETANFPIIIHYSLFNRFHGLIITLKQEMTISIYLYGSCLLMVHTVVCKNHAQYQTRTGIPINTTNLGWHTK